MKCIKCGKDCTTLYVVKRLPMCIECAYDAQYDRAEENGAEAMRLRTLLFEHYANCYKFGDCTTLDDRDANVTYSGDCIDCDLCASDCCDIDGWEIPPGGEE